MMRMKAITQLIAKVLMMLVNLLSEDEADFCENDSENDNERSIIQ